MQEREFWAIHSDFIAHPVKTGHSKNNFISLAYTVKIDLIRETVNVSTI